MQTRVEVDKRQILTLLGRDRRSMPNTSPAWRMCSTSTEASDPKHPVVCFDESPTQLILTEYNEARPHQGRWCFGKTPMQTFPDAMPMTKEKMIAA